jgi:predicted RNA-binding protein
MKIASGRPEGPVPVCGGLFFLWRCNVCEAKVYIGDEGAEQKVMDDVVLVQPEGDAYLLVNLLGEQKLVQGHIEKIDFLHHSLHLSRPQDPSATQS